MKRIFSMIAFVILCFLLQSTVLQSLALADTVPNLMLIIVVAIGYMRGQTEAMYFGLFCGLLVDCSDSNLIGMNALLFMLCGYVTGLGNKIYYREDFIMPICLVAASDFAFNIMFYIFTFLFRRRTDFIFYVRRIMLPELVYTVLLSIIVYKVIHWIIERLEKVEEREV